MTWNIHISDDAEQGLLEIESYIAGVLLEPVTAGKLVDRIMDAIESLDQFPLRYRVYDYEPWRTMGLRVLTVDNYVVLYLPNEATATVTVVHVIYGGRDIEAQLNQTE